MSSEEKKTQKHCLSKCVRVAISDPISKPWHMLSPIGSCCRQQDLRAQDLHDNRSPNTKPLIGMVRTFVSEAQPSLDPNFNLHTFH
jgi:hypothetical protein